MDIRLIERSSEDIESTQPLGSAALRCALAPGHGFLQSQRGATAIETPPGHASMAGLPLLQVMPRRSLIEPCLRYTSRGLRHMPHSACCCNMYGTELAPGIAGPWPLQYIVPMSHTEDNRSCAFCIGNFFRQRCCCWMLLKLSMAC